jgi:hypothetical protein
MKLPTRSRLLAALARLLAALARLLARLFLSHADSQHGTAAPFGTDRLRGGRARLATRTFIPLIYLAIGLKSSS